MRILILALLIFSDVTRAADKPPPLVLQPGKYSYTFAVPKGWEASFDAAARLGVRLVFFPSGGNFDESNTVVYINEICKSECGGTLKGAIEQALGDSLKQNPTQITEAVAPLRTFAGTQVPVRVLSGENDPRQAKEALVFIDTDNVVVLAVLTTKNTASWDADYMAFGQIIAGFKFFDCNSPNLAVKCR
jgi:hypothetical protein